MVSLPTLALVVVSALIDGINPCTLGVFILIVSTILGKGKSTKRLLLLGGAYILAIFIAYLAAGMGMFYLLNEIPTAPTQYIAVAIALIAVTAAVLQLKDYFWYGKGPSLHIPKHFAGKIQKMSKKSMSVHAVILLGIFVATIQLPCTGAPYLAVIAILKESSTTSAPLMLIFYNIVFVTPLLAVLLAVVTGTKISQVVSWKQENKATMRLMAAIALTALAWILILITNGSILVG